MLSIVRNMTHGQCERKCRVFSELPPSDSSDQKASYKAQTLTDRIVNDEVRRDQVADWRVEFGWPVGCQLESKALRDCHKVRVGRMRSGSDMTSTMRGKTQKENP